jgi:hypothetical protein
LPYHLSLNDELLRCCIALILAAQRHGTGFSMRRINGTLRQIKALSCSMPTASIDLEAIDGWQKKYLCLPTFQR